ncbi:uncharacterized protein EAF01_004952 [Botrytis porri]|uniref:uncharacterized protein n=1 Tax=Botrytis porri TaxID=87229 RepID=UPI0018FFDB23|nr:uncharacterized protein EAF01_004952 [Botrytis porri]KAF7907365.1 hypothetical protein EAF01_004952 [Botrytis porri]
MGIPQHALTIKRLANAVAKSVKKECAQALGKKHLCEDPKTLNNFGQCLKAQLLPVVMSYIGELMPLVTEPMCKKEFSYLQKSTLWEQLIPSYFDAYAKVCTKL